MGSPRITLRTGSPSGTGQLLAGVAWVVLLLGLWLWGREQGDVPAGTSGTAAGDMAAAGRPPGGGLSPAHRPLAPAAPRRLDVPALGIHVPVMADRPGRHGRHGRPDRPARPDAVGWYADGVTPGEPGTALMVGSAGLRRVAALEPGWTIWVARADAGTAEFTVEDVQVLARERFDARRIHEPRHEGRAELRLVACDEDPGRRAGGCRADVIVSAYLTGTGPPPATGS
ncbi:sortase domain-bontaining protein [Streptomyces sp. NPDC000348]|uniref:sortase domain-containing protein n=1 Tax=Streptomyces sp. NPDC000348 TaxID=3364538 RepID=UPI0036AB1699